MGNVFYLSVLAAAPPLAGWALLRLLVPGRVAPAIVKLVALLWLVAEVAAAGMLVLQNMQRHELAIFGLLHAVAVVVMCMLSSKRIELHMAFSGIGSPTVVYEVPGQGIYMLASQLARAYPGTAVMLRRGDDSERQLTLYVNEKAVLQLKVTGLSVTNIFRAIKSAAPASDAWPDPDAMQEVILLRQHGLMSYTVQ